MNYLADEKKLLRYTYLLCFTIFIDLFLIKDPFDKGAIIMAVLISILIGYSHFIIRRFFPDGDKVILIIASILSVIGIGVLYRLSTTVAIKQLIWFSIGVAGFIFIVVLLPDLERFKKLRYLYLIATLVAMSLGTLFAPEQYGSKNWISMFGVKFQPSEFGKLFLVAYLASALKEYESFKQLIEPAIVVMISLGFMVFQKDLGSALIFFGISVTMLYIATSKFKYVATCIGLFIIGGLISYKLFGHVRLRIMIWKDPFKYASNESLQVVQSMIAIASGGLFGSGLGLGYPNFVPVNQSDFIFAVICEELGLLTGIAIIILYFILFYRCTRAALRANNNFSRLLAVGYSATIASQVLVIIGGVMSIIPLTGITLPFVSYGGSSMIITFFSLGILQKISEEGV
ncbi:FtsW/RodA/SpoVE family cell cycle protein [Clostridium sp. KNHs214]|uniref:FtsW/RodA/SpoVE family cell cycle protein n=1 Tax=Clostridium sp. KNHs214 TaxID=1540257 RepID=UPI000553DBC1|nr:FtsW/RodA/SpoVE family cell cycle protein [Clostridium sp. KNHs214]